MKTHFLQQRLNMTLALLNKQNLIVSYVFHHTS